MLKVNLVNMTKFLYNMLECYTVSENTAATKNLRWANVHLTESDFSKTCLSILNDPTVSYIYI